MLEIENNAKDETKGTRLVPFSRELYIEQEDFMEEPVKKYFRLFPGNEVRLKGAYFVKCNDVIKDENGNVVEIHCTYNIQPGELQSYEKSKNLGVYVKTGKLTVNIYQATLDELGCEIKIGDYIGVNVNGDTSSLLYFCSKCSCPYFSNFLF